MHAFGRNDVGEEDVRVDKNADSKPDGGSD